MKDILRIIVERANIIDYIFNEGNRNRRIRNNNKRRRDTNHNKENDLSEASDVNRSEIGGDGSTKTGGTGSILIYDLFAESEYERTVNTNTHNNDETVQVADVIYSDSESYKGSN